MNNNSLTQSQFWSPCNITASYILCNWQTDRQTDRQHLVVSEVVALGECVNDWIDLLVVEEVNTLDATGTVPNVTIQLRRHTDTHTQLYIPCRHTDTHMQIYIPHTHTHTQTRVCRYWKQTCTENYNKYNKWHKAGWCGTSVSLWDTTAHLNPHRQLPRLSPYHPATARVHNSESREVNTS